MRQQSLMRLRVRFTGRVQGVGFRFTTRHIASGLPITGWVRNEPDGSVLLEAQGAEAAVKSLLKSLGEAMAGNIAGRDEAPIPEIPGESGFQIAR